MCLSVRAVLDPYGNLHEMLGNQVLSVTRTAHKWPVWPYGHMAHMARMVPYGSYGPYGSYMARTAAKWSRMPRISLNVDS